MIDSKQTGFKVGEWHAFPLRNVLDGPSGEVHLEPKVMQVLESLARHAGEVVERDNLLDELWGGRAQSDEPLTRCIATLRRILGDSAKDPEYIQTIPKRGYRLICPVESVTPGTEKAMPQQPGRLVRMVGIAFATVVAVALTAYLAIQNFRPESTLPTVAVESASTKARPVRSIAVLPFANLSAAAENEYLSDGLATELTSLLTTIPDLNVAARTSAFTFKGKDADITEIAEQLRVVHVLSGSVRQSGNRLRITAELVDASDGYHVWSDSWERELADIFDIQDEIAKAVSDALRLEVRGGSPLVHRATPEAYSYYLQSKSAYYEEREPDIGDLDSDRHSRALSLITHALAIDPEFAPAWTQLATVQFNQAIWTTSEQAEAFKRAEQSANRALELDPAQANALAVLGYIADTWHWDSVQAATYYKRALAAAPESASLRNSISILFGRFGRAEDALRYLQEAFDRDPLNTGLSLNLALSYWYVRDFGAARAQLQRVKEKAPNAVRLRVFEGLFAYYEGNYNLAADLFEGQNPALYACSLHKQGRVDEAIGVLDELLADNPVGANAVATVHACRNDKNAALEWLDRAFENHEPGLRWVRSHAYFEFLHDDPRWESLLQNAGVSDDHAQKVIEIFPAKVK
ncbi:MAG: hypothetical protein HKN77_09420 [Woeseiaceae bacterium]|nr:hypothetical protein [Woeseiaceae bacterium]